MSSRSSRIEAFPDEVLTRIFQHLHLENHIRNRGLLSPCISICRKWYQLALPVLWQSFHVDTEWETYHRRQFDDDYYGFIAAAHYWPAPPKFLWGYVVQSTEFLNGLSVRPSRLDCLLAYLREYQAEHSNPETGVKRAFHFDMCRYVSICLDDPKHPDVAS